MSGLDTMPGGLPRQASSAQYNLLAATPVEQTPGDAVTYSPAQIKLTPSKSGGMAYAIFKVNGLGTDGSVFPETVDQECNLPYYLGVADYARGTWQFYLLAAGGQQQLTGGAGLVSPGGSCYIAVIGCGWDTTLTSLKLNLNSVVPGAPTAVITQQGNAAELWPAAFNAAGSIPGLGAFSSFTYTFDGGDQQVVNDPAAEVTHTFPVGQHTVQLMVTNDLGLNHSTTLEVQVAPACTDLLVIYNSDIPEDLDLAEYYMSPRTGRGIHPDYKLGLPLGAYSPTISRANYETQIRGPVQDFILADEQHDLVINIEYLLLLKGIPHQIPGADEFDVYHSTYSSVDSELCVLLDQPPIDSFAWNSNVYFSFAPIATGFYLQGDQNFRKLGTSINWKDPDSESYYIYALDFLVGRLSAYTYDEAKLLVDRSLAASAPGAADWVVFDSCDGRKVLDTMVDPVYDGTDFGDASQDSGVELLTAAGLNVFADVTTERIVNGSALLPAGFNNSVIGYAGWGVNHTGGSYAHNENYILQDLGWNYAPGACFMSYESFNGTDFDDSDGINRRGQGQICDFIRMGGTVAIGNAYEPFSVGVGDERWVFDRYLNHGDRWIEAAYKGLRMISWQEVVVGDPLCKLQ